MPLSVRQIVGYAGSDMKVRDLTNGRVGRIVGVTPGRKKFPIVEYDDNAERQTVDRKDLELAPGE